MNLKKKSDSLTFTLDVVCSGFVRLLLVLTIIFAHRIPEWQTLALQFSAASVLYLIAAWIVNRMSEGFSAMAVRTAIVLGLFGFLFGAVAGLQHILVAGWRDDVLLSLEHTLTGTESTLLLQKFIHPFLTEGMMFAYVIYVAMLPLVAYICFWAGGQRATNDYLLNLSLANIGCYLGFILFPVASPMYYQPELYTVPLQGGFFTWCGEWMRHNVHYAGGSLPSPHCAAATVMLMMLYRYNRKIFFVALPTIITLYVSTVYGRYHYALDGIAGIITAVVVVKFSPMLVTLAESARIRLTQLLKTSSVTETISE